MEDHETILEVINQALNDWGLPNLSRKRTTTHGGEWYAPCPRCKMLGHASGGSDRFLVWPYRPMQGGSERRDPVFMCRVCRRPDDDSREWTGDLVQFVQDMYGLTYSHALARLGLESQAAGGKLLAPFVEDAAPPPEAWQRQAEAVLEDAIYQLWQPEGRVYLEYLTKVRGISEKMVEHVMLGCITEHERYEDGALWGMEDVRVRLPRGILIPEYHQGVLWSLSVRRGNADVQLEEDMTGKKASRYHLVRGGTKGLYMADTITAGSPVVLCEGQFNAIIAYQATERRFGAVATQSAIGARDIRWQRMLSRANPAILCFDPDNAGEEASSFWMHALEHTFKWTHYGDGDLNDLHTQGIAVGHLLQTTVDRYSTIILPPGTSPSGLSIFGAVIVPIEDAEVTTGCSEPNTATPDWDALWDAGCKVCGAVPDHYSDDATEVYCEDHWQWR